ncbi:hypothetical protein LTR53_003580 [Teratosphaeriaceae sp. CCFEE 6253]|nr:hypothetical protein LTR53_003580 [Teratosphaeriaceae sp. CCFEE 6253]
MTSPPPTLNDLPSELVALIYSFLDDSSTLATRFTSRHIERATLSTFGHRFFRKKGYLVTTPSLNVLTQVSQHEDLRKNVQHVWLNPDCFTFVQPDCAPDAQEAPDPDDPDSILQLLSPNDRRQYEAFQDVKVDHSRLLARSGRELESVLKPIFAALPNLKIIGMRRSENHAPWGWRQLHESVGEDPRVLGLIPSGPMYWLSEPTRLFLAIVNAVAATPSMKLRRFYTDVIEVDNIRPELLTQETLDKACAGIWYLELNIAKAWLRRREEAEHIMLSNPEHFGSGLIRLLKATAELKEIGFQIFSERRQPGRSAPPMRDSYPYLCFRNLVKSVQLPHVTRIKLEEIVTTPDTLCAFLTPSASHLTSLKIRYLRLLSDPEKDPKPWRPVFAFLLASCPALEHLYLYRLLWEEGGSPSSSRRKSPTPPRQPRGPYRGSKSASTWSTIHLRCKSMGGGRCGESWGPWWRGIVTRNGDLNVAMRIATSRI